MKSQPVARCSETSGRYVARVRSGLPFHDSEAIRLMPHPGHSGDDAARTKVDHVEVTEFLRERR
jgi:hypothetical protein